MSKDKHVYIRNRSWPGATLFKAKICSSYFCRLRGLALRKSLPPNWGLLLVQRNENRIDSAIHMLWMRMDLAVVWINTAGKVVDVRPAYRWRSFLTPAGPAKYVLETSIDQLNRFSIGDEVYFEEIPPV